MVLTEKACARHIVVAMSLALWGCSTAAGTSSDSGTVDSSTGADSMGDIDSTPLDIDSGQSMPDSGQSMVDSSQSTVDSGQLDASIADSGTTVDSGCATPCDDGLYCNGLEVCSGTTCVPGTSFDCADSVACTVDACVEPVTGTTPTCTNTADDNLCTGTDQCLASFGCIPMCAESPCRLVDTQCGCAPGQGCYSSGAARACVVAGTDAEGATCTSITSCVPGNTCLEISRDMAVSIPQCGRYCASDTDCPGPGALCITTLTGSSDMLCTRDCNPLTGTGCSAAASCQVLQESAGAMRFVTDCVGPLGTGGQGATCTDSTDCQNGFTCAGAPGTCLAYCTTPGTPWPFADCSGTLTCYGFVTPLQPGGPGNQEYGVCDT